MLEFNKQIDTTALNYRDDWAFLQKLLNQPDFMEALYQQASAIESRIDLLSDLQVMKIIIERVNQKLRDSAAELANYSQMGGVFQPVSLELAIRHTIRTIDKVLERWHRRISDSIMTHTLLQVVMHSQTNGLVAEVLHLMAKHLFSIEDKDMFYVIRAYMEHFNSYNNKRTGIDGLLQPQPKDLMMEFTENNRRVTIEATHRQLMEMRQSGQTIYQIAKKLYPNNQGNLHVFLAVIVKLRLVTCASDELYELVECVLVSFQIFNMIQISWYRSDQTRKQIPEIFIFPPDYENIFLEFFELFSLRECDTRTHLNILHVIKSILETEQKAEQGSDLFLSLAEHFIFIRRIINDVNNSLQGKPLLYFTKETIGDKAFIKIVLELLCLCNVYIEDILEVSYEIAQKVAFSQDFDKETVSVACLLLTYQPANEAKQERLVDKFVEEICQTTSQHISTYVRTLVSYFEQENRYSHAQRRDSTALARRLVESPMFANLKKLIPFEPIRSDSVAFRTIDLIEHICSEAPLLTDKLHDIIEHLLILLCNPKDYPESAESLVKIPSFLHHICLKEGQIRSRVMSCHVLEAMINIYTIDKFVRILSLNHHAGPISHFFGSINRFLVNIPLCKNGIYRGLVMSCQQLIGEMREFERYLDLLLVNNQSIPQTVRYENITFKINNVMRLIIKVSGNLNIDCTELYNCTQIMFKLKYLNIHNPSENRWMTHNARLIEQPKSEITKLNKIATEIKMLINEIDLKQYVMPKSVKPFFKVFESIGMDPINKLNFKISVNLNRLDRLINLARTSNDPNPIYKRVNVFRLIGQLDKLRMADVQDIDDAIGELHNPLTSDELKDFLQHTLKSLAEKGHIGLTLQFTLKRLLNEACKARSFDVNRQISICITNELNDLHSSNPTYTLESIYLTKLKVDNVQYMLQIIPMVMHDYSKFPCNFTTFSYFYQEDSSFLFKTFLILIALYTEQSQGDANQKNFKDLLRNEILKKIVIVLQSICMFDTNQSQDEKQAKTQQQKKEIAQGMDCVRYVIVQMLAGYIHLALGIPQSYECAKSSALIVKHILTAAITGINKLAALGDENLEVCKIIFPVDPAKRIPAGEFKRKIDTMMLQFNAQLLDNLQKWQLYEVPLIETICMHPILTNNLFKWKERLRSVYNYVCINIINVTKHLFLQYPIDLGIRHPKSEDIEYESVNVRSELNKLNIYLTTIVEVIKTLTKNKWYGSGELVITSNNICELIKLSEHILLNVADLSKDDSKPLKSIDPMIKRILVLVECYKIYEGQRKIEINRLKRNEKSKEIIRIQPIRARKRKNRRKQQQKKEFKEDKQDRQRQTPNLKLQKTKSVRQEPEVSQQRNRPRKKKNRTKKKQSNVALCLQNMLQCLLSQQTPLIECNTLQHIILFLSDNLKVAKKTLRIRMDELGPLIVQAKLTDQNRFGLIEDLSVLVIRLFSQHHILLDIEASIKRIFFQMDKDAKDGWLPMPHVLKQIKVLTESFSEDLLTLSFRSLCQFRNDTEVITLTNKQILQTAEQNQDKYYVKLQNEVDLTTMTATISQPLKNKNRKSLNKELVNQPIQEPSKYLDYIPDGPLQTIIKAIIDCMIQDIILFIDRRVTNQALSSSSAFDFNILAKVLRVVVRESSILIPFITRYKCRRVLNICLARSSEQTRRIISELLIKRDKQAKVEFGDITFMSLLLRLFTTIGFKNLERLIFLLCLDNYVLCRSPKNVVQSIGYWIRIKVIEELGSGGCGWIRNLAYLNLLLNLLDIKEFSRQCIQEEIINYLHKQFILTHKTQNAEFFYGHLPFILNPLTVLHNINLTFNITKPKPTVIRGKHKANQVKNQLIPKNFLRKNSFAHNWLYQSIDSEITRGQYSRHYHRNGEFDDSHFVFGSQGEDLPDQSISNEDNSQNEEEMSGSLDQDDREALGIQQQEADEDSDISSVNGWTESINNEGFSVNDHNSDDGQSLNDIQMNDEGRLGMQYNDDDLESNNDGLSDQPSRIIIEQLFGDVGSDSSEDSGDSIRATFFADVQGNLKIFNHEVRRMADQVESLIAQVFTKKDQSNPIYQRVHKQQLFQFCQSVEQWIATGQHIPKQGKHIRDVTSLAIEFREPKMIFDDTNLLLPQRWRRRAEYIQRPRIMTGTSIQVDPEQIPPTVNNFLGMIAARRLENEQQEPQQQRIEIQPEEEVDDEIENDLDEMQDIDDDLEGSERNDTDALIRIIYRPHNAIDNEEMQLDNMGGMANTDANLEQLLQRNNIDINEFRLMPRDLQRDIIQNFNMVEMPTNPEEMYRVISSDNNQIQPNQQQNAQEQPQQGMEQQLANQQEQQLQQPQPEPDPNTVYDRRRKLSHDYVKKIAKDPRQILLKEKKEHKLYVCEDNFIVSVLSLLYQDETAHNDFPFALLKSLCANPINQTKFLTVLMIILKHPNLSEEKIVHGQTTDVFPMTILRQKNGELGTDYRSMGYVFISLKIVHILSNLSKTNSSAMLESNHNKVDFLPEWYWLFERPYYIHLIELLDNPIYKESSLRSYLTETIFNIIRHYCLKFIHDNENLPTKEFKLRLGSNQVRLLCSLLETSDQTQHISEVIMLLCIDENNLTTFIYTIEMMLNDISVGLSHSLRNPQTDDKFSRGHLKKILSIVYDMFQSEYISRLGKTQQRSKVKTELLRSFKSLIECKSLQQLCHEWIEYMCDNNISQFQMATITEILECFFIIYKITVAEEEQKGKRRNISALGDITTTENKDQQQMPRMQFSLDSEFKYICLKGRTIVNSILKQKILEMRKHRQKEEPASIFDDPMVYILAKNSSLIDYDNKRSMFKTQIKNIKARDKGHRTMELQLSREHVLQQSMNEIMARSGEELKGKLHIQFADEEGQDAGGLTREWFSLLSREMFNPNYAIFQPSSTGNTYQPSPKSYINPHHLVLFKFVGRIVGKAMHDGFIMEAFFTPAFYKHILGLPITYRDMQQQDYEFYKNMVWMIENDITDVLDLTFSYEYDDFGELRVKDLKPDGRNIPVTQSNKLQYIQMLCYAKMATAVQKQIEAFLEGFHELIPPNLVSIFDSKELELMISGLPTIEIQDLKDNTDLVNYDRTDNVIVWLFEVLEGFDISLRASFLQFVTGTSRLPSEGFKGLRGVNGPQKFNIHKDFDSSKLPRAHTCFNQLDLPNYPTKEVLIEKLTIAITEGKEGFGLI